MTSHYSTLGIDPTADEPTIKRAYQRRASKTHPDRAGGDKAQFQAVQRAYTVLSDATSRERYDRTGEDSTRTLDAFEQEASSNLASAFQMYIDQMDERTDPVKFVRNGLAEARKHFHNDIEEARRQIAALEKKRGVLRKKNLGVDLFANILDERIKNQQRRLDESTNREKMMVRSLELLDEYESLVVEMPKPAAQPYTTSFNEILSQHFNNASVWK